MNHLLIAALAAVGVAAAAWRARALALSGAIAAAIVGFGHYGFGGWAGAVSLLVFFVTSSALSRLGKRRKEALAFEKGGERDAGQVLANGGVATLCAFLLPLFPDAAPLIIVALLGALATANADTWATELGALAKHPPIMITTLKPAPTGASGAVSLPGTLAAAGGALLVALTALCWPALATHPLLALLAVAVGGFAGALFDSLLGATVQVQYRCAVCDKLTERTEHCGQPTVRARGISVLNNDAVNALATAFGALIAAGIVRLIG